MNIIMNEFAQNYERCLKIILKKGMQNYCKQNVI